MPAAWKGSVAVAAAASALIKAFKIALVVLVFSVGLVLSFEVAAHLVMPELVANWRALAFGDRRVLFISPGAIRDRAGYFNFRPDADIRAVTYYPNGKGRFTVEDDCTFTSDRLGFLSNTIAYQDSEILLLGDSFAQGSGGCAWMPRLAPDVRSRIYSAAVLGTGVKHWRNILRDLERLKKPTKILIVFITHDFFRDDWLFAQAQLDCLSNRGDCTGQFWYPVSDGMAKIAAERYALRNPALGRSGVTKFLRYHLIASFTLFEKLKRRMESASQIFEESVGIVTDMAKRYPLKLIWVNEKSEVEGPGPRTRLLWKRLEALDVTRCAIPADGFLPRDGHPNAKGYDVLKACVERVVRNW